MEVHSMVDRIGKSFLSMYPEFASKVGTIEKKWSAPEKLAEDEEEESRGVSAKVFLV
jgi:hypothetical protein